MKVMTIAARKARTLERLRAAGVAAIRELRDYAAHNDGVRFEIFGSFARGDIVATSDFDLVIEAPDTLLRQAREDVETLCDRLGLRPDVYLAREVSEGLRLRVDRDAIVVP